MLWTTVLQIRSPKFYVSKEFFLELFKNDMFISYSIKYCIFDEPSQFIILLIKKNALQHYMNLKKIKECTPNKGLFFKKIEQQTLETQSPGKAKNRMY